MLHAAILGPMAEGLVRTLPVSSTNQALKVVDGFRVMLNYTFRIWSREVGGMKLIDYDKYTKKWTPRSVIMLLLVEALVTGFFLGVSLMEGTSPHKSSGWIFPLVLAFSGAVGVLQTTLIALHNCQPPAATQTAEVSAN